MNLKSFLFLFFFLGVLSISNICGQSKTENLTVLITGSIGSNSANMALIRHIEKKLGRKIRIEIVPVSKEIKEKIANKEVDLALLTPYNFAHVQSQFKNKVITALAAPATSDGKIAFYHSCIFARKDIPVKSIKDLIQYAPQLRFSFTKASSTSGHVFPRLQLATEGIPFPEDIFKNVDFSGGHTQTIDLVLNNKAEVGGVAYEHLRDALNEKPQLKKDIQILWESYPLPHATVVARANLDNTLKKQITNILLKIHHEIPKDTFEVIKGIWGVDEITQFVEADDKVYQPIIQSAQKAGGTVNFLNYYEEKIQKQASELDKGKSILQNQNKEIDKQKQILSTQLIQIKNQQLLVYLFLALAILAIISGVLIFRSYQLKKQANQLLLEKNIQIQSQQEEILTQNEELHQQQEEILTQRDNIEQKNKTLEHQNQQIHNSIRAAVTIQQAILPYKDKIDKLLKDYFILYQPKDIVSGDFFWLNEINGKTILVVADCTGHGIPGAFMTLIGNTLLDKIIRLRGVVEPSKILNDLHEEVRIVLQQEKEQNNYGMDAAVICLERLNHQQVQLEFCGAKTDLLYLPYGANKMFALFGNRRSIGGIQNETKKFTSQIIQLAEGTAVYIGTDGLKDQNDERRKKFGFKRLIEHLEQNAHLSFETQKEELLSTLNGYMKNTSQRDDILWIGFKV